MPLLATTYCHHFASEDLYARFGLFSERPTDRSIQKDNHVLSSGLKSLSSWHMINTLQTCREACGGQGFKSSNLIGIYKSDMDVHATYEGDNWVLLQTVFFFFCIFARKQRQMNDLFIYPGGEGNRFRGLS